MPDGEQSEIRQLPAFKFVDITFPGYAVDNLEVDTAVPNDAEDFPDLGTSPGRAFNDFGWRKLTTMHSAPGEGENTRDLKQASM